MAAVTAGEEEWPLVGSKYGGLEQVDEALKGADEWQEFARRFAEVSRSGSSWEELLRSGTAEQAGSIAQHAATALASGRHPDIDELETTLAELMRAVVKRSEQDPLMAALVLGGVLSAVGGAPTAKLLRIWFDSPALESVVRAVLQEAFRHEVAQRIVGWLCGLPERLACVAAGQAWLQRFPRRLVHALVSSMDGGNDTALDFVARAALRGHAALLAAKICFLFGSPTEL